MGDEYLKTFWLIIQRFGTSAHCLSRHNRDYPIIIDTLFCLPEVKWITRQDYLR